jgi:hypothetical protein
VRQWAMSTRAHAVAWARTSGCACSRHAVYGITGNGADWQQLLKEHLSAERAESNAREASRQLILKFKPVIRVLPAVCSCATPLKPAHRMHMPYQIMYMRLACIMTGCSQIHTHISYMSSQ